MTLQNLIEKIKQKILISEVKIERNVDNLLEVPIPPVTSLEKEEDEVTSSDDQCLHSPETILPSSPEEEPEKEPEEPEETTNETLLAITEQQSYQTTNYNSDVEIKFIFDKSDPERHHQQCQPEETKEVSYTSSPMYSNSSKEEEFDELISADKNSFNAIGIQDETITQQEQQEQQETETKEVSYTSSPIYSNSSKEEEFEEFKSNQEETQKQPQVDSEKVVTVITRVFQSSSESSVDKQTFSSVETYESVSTNEDNCHTNKNVSLKINSVSISPKKSNNANKSPTKKRTPSTASNSSSLNYSLSPSTKNGPK